MKNLNHIGAGEKLLNQIQLRNSSTVHHWTRQQQLETYKLQKNCLLFQILKKTKIAGEQIRITRQNTKPSSPGGPKRKSSKR